MTSQNAFLLQHQYDTNGTFRSETPPLVVSILNPFFLAYAFANSAVPNERVHHEPTHQDLLCLPAFYWFLLKSLFAKMNVSIFRDGRVHFINLGGERVNEFIQSVANT